MGLSDQRTSGRIGAQHREGILRAPTAAFALLHRLAGGEAVVVDVDAVRGRLRVPACLRMDQVGQGGDLVVEPIQIKCSPIFYFLLVQNFTPHKRPHRSDTDKLFGWFPTCLFTFSHEGLDPRQSQRTYL